MWDSAVLRAWVEHNFWLAFGLACAALVLAAVIQGLVRRRRGLPVLRPKDERQIFSQDWTTASRTMLGTGRKCCWVSLTPEALTVGLHFPFSVLLPLWMGRIFGPETKLALREIVHVKADEHPLVGSVVAVAWREGGVPRTLSVSVRQPDAFIQKVTTAARAVGAPV
jgi:hypothetical protein